MGAGRDEDPSVSIHATGSGRAQMPILGGGTQQNYFGGTDNHDIRVVVVHEHDVIDLEVGPPQRVSVEITNHGTQARRLSLRVEGVPLGAVEPATVSVRSGEDVRAWLVLSCTPTKPEAGRRRIVVRATDTAGYDSGPSWVSNEKTVHIPAHPTVTVSPGPPVSEVSGAGTHKVSTVVRNAGNTRLRVSVRYPGRTWIAANVFPGRAGRLVTGEQLGFGAEVDLEPGEEQPVPVAVWLPARGLRDRRWVLPLMAQPNREDAASGFTQLSVHQRGVLADLRFGRSDPDGVQRSDAQGRRLVALPQWAVVAVCLGVLTVGSVIAIKVWPGPGAAAGVAPSAPTSAPGSSVPLAPDPFKDYGLLPCAPGTNMVFLATVGGLTAPDHEQTRKHADTIRYYERERIELINQFDPGAGLDADRVKVSRLNPDCGTYRFFHQDPRVRENQLTIWYDPETSEPGTANICAVLHKDPADGHCSPHTVA